MAAVHGVSMILKVDVSATATAIGLSRSATLNLSMEDVDITTKASNYWRQRIPSLRDWSVDFDAIFDEADDAQDQLWTSFDTDPSAAASVNLVVSGDTYSGNMYITDMTIEGPHDAEVSISGSLVGAGEPVRVTA